MLATSPGVMGPESLPEDSHVSPGTDLPPCPCPGSGGPQDPRHPPGYREGFRLCLALAVRSEQSWMHTETPKRRRQRPALGVHLPAPRVHSLPLFLPLFPFPSQPGLQPQSAATRVAGAGARTPQCDHGGSAPAPAHARLRPGRPRVVATRPPLAPGLQARREAPPSAPSPHPPALGPSREGGRSLHPAPGTKGVRSRPARHQRGPGRRIPIAEGKLRKPSSPLG